MNKLQKALSINAIFSGVSGLILSIFSQPIAQVFEVNQSYIFLIIGLGLLFFAATIFIEIKKQRKQAVLWIIIQDFMWVLGSVVLLIWQPFDIADIGNMIIAAIALIVLFMAINQVRALNLNKEISETT